MTGTRRERIVVETDRHRIVGDVTLPSEGVRTRLSDLLNREGLQFIALTDTEISLVAKDGPPLRLPFVAVARDHIQIAYEADR